MHLRRDRLANVAVLRRPLRARSLLSSDQSLKMAVSGRYAAHPFTLNLDASGNQCTLIEQCPGADHILVHLARTSAMSSASCSKSQTSPSMSTVR